MTMTEERHRKFSTKRTDDATGEPRQPVTFEINDEIFTCIPEIAGSVILDFVAAANDPDPAISTPSVMYFFTKSMSEAEYLKFREYVDDPDNGVHIELLSEMVSYLIEEYTERPTTPS